LLQTCKCCLTRNAASRSRYQRVYVGLARTDIHTVYDRMYGDFPAKNTTCTLYIPINVWFWPTLALCDRWGFYVVLLMTPYVLSLVKQVGSETVKAKLPPKALGNFCRDLCQEVREGKVDPVIGRDREVARTIQVNCLRGVRSASF